MRRFRFTWLGLFPIILFFACSQQTSAPTPESEESKEAEAAEVTEKDQEGDLVAVIRTNKGNIVVELLAEGAPRTVKRFMQLARGGFYTRTTFHYVSSGFIWGGDPFSKDNNPTNDGLGNAGEWITAEFSDEVKVGRGIVGMMRKDDQPDSSSCQFFIVLKRKREWDGKYNVFGRVIEGIEVAEAISKVPKVKNNPKLNNYPTAKQLIKGITIERRVTEVESPEASS